MGIKRKASDSLPPCPSDFPGPYSFNPPSGGFITDPSSDKFFPAGLDSPQHHPFLSDPLSSPPRLPSRTRKRFRNNRPDDETVHQVTLRKLFTAQQTPEYSNEPPTPLSIPDEDAPGNLCDINLPPVHSDPVMRHQKTLLSYFAPRPPPSTSLSKPSQRPNPIQMPPSPESMHLPSSPCSDLIDRPRRTAFHQDRPKLDLGAANWQNSSCLSPTLGIELGHMDGMLPTPAAADGDVDMMEFECAERGQEQLHHLPWLGGMLPEAG